MASNYEAISKENLERYGIDIDRIGPMLLADRYHNRTHFIFELLQNAEDALRRRGSWTGPRKVSFELTPTALELSHFGRPFDEADVRGVCGIAQSTKDPSSIGRFGIGFKSVYTFTDRPEIHSGEEDFAIESYVHPTRVDRKRRAPEETRIILPLKSQDKAAREEITVGLQQLGPGALLFLRHIEEISWRAEDEVAGFYLRNPAEPLGPNVQRITVIGQQSGQLEVDQSWLVFHREVLSPTKECLGRVELAFLVHADETTSGCWSLQPVLESPLVVYFPTVLLTNLGFLVQGPYLTTPSRDNIRDNEPWNRHLIEETASLLVEAMRWLRDQSMLDISALRCLPVERDRFAEGSRFAPLFNAVKRAFVQEPMLPRFGGGYVAASQAKLARTQDLRELLSPEQLAAVFDTETAAWLTGEITQDRAPEIRQYLMREIGISEVTPPTLVARLSREFLQAQSDDWILRLYEFLSDQEAALRNRLESVPLMRLSDGSHVVARENGKPKAFLPGSIETDFPTIRREVCSTPQAREFLASLGLTEPDLVDDVIWNVLPKYRRETVDGDAAYVADIERIRSAFGTDSKVQRDKLLSALRETSFVRVLAPKDSSRSLAKPTDIYIATDRLKQLFGGVQGVWIVDDEYDCLRGESMRELLEACGALRYPRPEPAPHALTHDEQLSLRRAAGHEQTSYQKDRIEDWTLQGFDSLIKSLSSLSTAERTERARLIWESLGDLEERRGRGIFEGTYSWSHYGNFKRDFPAAFVRHLNAASWVPDANGELQPPSVVVFETLGWIANPFLLTKITFKPPIIDQLAREAGIDPAALDLLRKLGITSVAELTSRLGIVQPPSAGEPKTPAAAPCLDEDVYDGAKDLYGDDMPHIRPGTYDPNSSDGARGDAASRGHGHSDAIEASGGHYGNGGREGDRHGTRPENGGGGSPGKSSPTQTSRTFISYIGTHPTDEEPDPDGLDHVERMRIERQAIAKILSQEPALRPTPPGNVAFDLYELNDAGEQTRWVEVKSMTGSLEQRPVGLSRAQFDYASHRGSSYWLYIVEHAMDPQKARVLRIQDPVAYARTFTFDRGWIHVAITELQAQPSSV